MSENPIICETNQVTVNPFSPVNLEEQFPPLSFLMVKDNIVCVIDSQTPHFYISCFPSIGRAIVDKIDVYFKIHSDDCISLRAETWYDEII